MGTRSRRLWNATAYDLYRSARLRPAMDLLNGIPLLKHPAQTILDLGCGSGSMLPILSSEFPNASIFAVDSSMNMLESAQKKVESTENITFHHMNMEEFLARNCPERVDLIYSNAAFHWMPFSALRPLLIKLYHRLNSGGILAFQIPDSRQQASHVEMENVASQFPSLQNIRVPRNEVNMKEYYELFKTQTSSEKIDLWTTTYSHPLPMKKNSDTISHPVVDFYASTGLGPFLEACDSKEERDTFYSEYEQKIQECYPLQSDGTAFLEITRLFATIQKP